MVKKLLSAIERWLEARERMKDCPRPGVTPAWGAPTLDELQMELNIAEREVEEVLNSLRAPQITKL